MNVNHVAADGLRLIKEVMLYYLPKSSHGTERVSLPIEETV